MESRRSAVVFGLGFLIVAFAVGGVENSITDGELIESILLALGGIATMAFGLTL